MDALDAQLELPKSADYDTENMSALATSGPGSNVVQENTKSKTQRSSFNDFVRKLYLILESEQYKSILSWSDDGQNFIVLDTNRFTTDILPNHFKHSNFSSFVRQLNKYDFHKVKRKKTEEPGVIQNAWEFNHQFFKRHDEAALDKIRRKPSSQKKILVDENAATLMKLGVGSSGDGSGEESLAVKTLSKNMVNKTRFNQMKRKVEDLENQVQFLTNENHKSKLDMQKVQSKYNMVLESLLSTEALNSQLLSNFQLLVDTLSQQGLKLPVGLSFPKRNPSSSSKGQGQDSSSVSPENSSMVNLPNQHPMAKQGNMDLSPMGGQLALQPGFHVLLVEDDSVCIQLCSKFLRKYGCSVEVVTDGLSAISTLEKQRFDLVLMDIVMPNLDGATATSIVRSFDNETPIIAMTGNIDDQDLVTYLQHGMNDILAKPFTKDDLHSMLIRYLKDRIPLSEQNRSPNDDNKSYVDEPLLKKPHI